MGIDWNCFNKEGLKCSKMIGIVSIMEVTTLVCRICFWFDGLWIGTYEQIDIYYKDKRLLKIGKK